MNLEAILLMAISTLLVSCGGGGSAQNTEPCTVELNGDSIIATNQVASFSGYIKFMRPSFAITDKAVGGMQLNQMQRVFTSHVVLVELGGNDAETLTDEQFKSLFTSVINQIKTEGRVPVVTGVVPLTYEPGSIFSQAKFDAAQRFDQFIHVYASENKVLDANWRATVSYNREIDTTDGIHLTKAASEKFADQTIKVLDQACKTVK